MTKEFFYKNIAVPFDYVRQVYQKADMIVVPPHCNGFTATNIGAINASVEDQPIFHGEVDATDGDSITFGGNQGDVYIKKAVKLQFASNDAGAAVEFVFKVYVFD